MYNVSANVTHGNTCQEFDHMTVQDFLRLHRAPQSFRFKYPLAPYPTPTLDSNSFEFPIIKKMGEGVKIATDLNAE